MRSEALSACTSRSAASTTSGFASRAICRWNPVIANSEKQQICAPRDRARIIARQMAVTFSRVVHRIAICPIAMRRVPVILNATYPGVRCVRA
jgi:hypothetical protein